MMGKRTIFLACCGETLIDLMHEPPEMLGPEGDKTVYFSECSICSDRITIAVNYVKPSADVT
ncbi:hypothetical protein LCGC14_0394450 [marine sediment metagenome]|uniref:Uncharacterized protein n=1 Tax=marine sediment metagenome TaxID=412755 RepID=A0A0F9SYT3_9ZZZZ